MLGQFLRRQLADIWVW